MKMKRAGRNVGLSVAKQDGGAGCILARGVVKGNIQFARLSSIVKSNDEPFFLGFAQKDIRSVIGGKMPELAATQRFMLASEPQKLLDVGKNVLLLGRASLRGESILFIFAPAAGEIAAIVRIVSSRHGDFITVIELRNAAKSKRQTESELHLSE